MKKKQKVINFDIPKKVTDKGMYVVAVDKKGLYLLRNLMIMPIMCQRYFLPYWLKKFNLEIYSVYWIDPKLKSIEACKGGDGDGNSQTAEAIQRHVLNNYRVYK